MNPEVNEFRVQNLTISKTTLGAGGFSHVYRGIYLNRGVAIKMPGVGAADPAAQLAALRKEIEILQAVRHPRLVRFIGVAGAGATAGAASEEEAA